MLLQLRLKLTARELAAEFAVSERTIYRDIEELSQAGIPIYSESGPGGGFQLVDGYRTKLTGLASEEAEAVFMIGLPGAASALGLGDAATRAGRKLLAALPPALSESAGRLGGRFHLDAIDWYRAAEPAPHLPALARAVLDQRALTMTYESWKKTREWRVEPLGLVLKAGAWYLVARDGGGRDDPPRTFKASKVLTLQVEAAACRPLAGFDLASYWRQQLERFENDLRPGRARLRASLAGLERLAKLGAYAASAVADAVASAEPGDENALLTLPFENLDQAALALLGIGPEIDVLDPSELRERLRDLAAQVLARLTDSET